jgi:hypothetical protein
MDRLRLPGIVSVEDAPQGGAAAGGVSAEQGQRLGELLHRVCTLVSRVQDRGAHHELPLDRPQELPALGAVDALASVEPAILARRLEERPSALQRGAAGGVAPRRRGPWR